jgi:hypothetical protein
MASPVRGTSGNVEFLVHARVPAGAAPAEVPPVGLRALVDDTARADEAR